MVNKRTARKQEADPDGTDALRPKGSPAPGKGLRCSETPGVYLNEFNTPCDADGVALSFKQVKARDTARFEEVIGEHADTPAKFLKAVSLDPRMPMLTRIDAAKAAAPYSDRKQPIAIDGGAGDNGKPVPLFDPRKLSGLSDKELGALRDLLAKAGSAA